MPIPVAPNPSYPLVAPAISLINAYLEQGIPESEVKGDDWSSQLPRTLQLRLPRRAGSTFICHQAVEFTSAFIVLQNDHHVKHFRHKHEIMFKRKSQLPIFSVYELKNVRSTCLLDPNLTRLAQISKNLRSSRGIFFDAFASYSDNNVIKSLFFSCQDTHKFVMLW